MSHRDANRFFAPRRMLLAMLLLAGCGGGDGPTDPGPPAGGDPDPNPPPATTGQVVFWTDNAGLAPIAVNVNGGSGSISAAHSAAPACGAAGAYTVTLPPGSHSFTGSNAAGVSWNGSVPVTAGGCTPWRLYSTTPPPATTGQVVFWTDNAQLVPISVQVNGLTGSITASHAAAPACGAAGAYTAVLPAGAQTFSGSNGAGLSWNGSVTVTAGSCTTFRLFSNAAPPPAPTTGQVAFWTDDSSLVPISVTVGSVAGSITAGHAAAPACGAAGAYTVTLAAGSHGYTAQGAGVQWSGTVTVAAGQCTRLRLFRTSPPPPSPTTGRVMFWTDVASLAPISVTMNGASGNIASAYSSVPACGAAGTHTVTLAPGTYSYTAVNAGGTRWSGNATVTAGQCLALKLTASSTPPPGNNGCSELVQIAPLQPGQTTGWFPSRRWAGLDYKVNVGTFQYDGNEREYWVYVRNRYTTSRAWVSVGFKVGAQPSNTTDRLGAIQPGGDDDATWFIEPYGRTSYLLVDAVRVGASDSGAYFCPAPPTS